MKYFGFFVLLLVLHVVLLQSVQFIAWPEMLTYPWLIDQGFRFYGDIMHPYLPLLPFTLTFVYRVIGISVVSLKLVTVLTLLSVDVLLFLIARKLYSPLQSLVPTLFFIPISILFEGNGLWFDIASVPFVLGAYYFLLPKGKNKRVILAGVLIGMAVLVKQTNIIYTLPALFLLKDRKRGLIKFLVSAVSPLAVTTVVFFLLGQLHQFLYWGIIYPVFILSRMPSFPLAPTAKQILITLFVFSPVALTLKKQKLFSVLTVVSLIFAIPRFAYFHLLPASVFLVLRVAGLTNYKLPVTFYAVGVAFITIWSFTPPSHVRFFEGEVEAVKEELVQTLPHDSDVFFLNLPSQYFVMTPLKIAKPWADTFPWYFELPHVREMTLKSLEDVEYVVIRSPGVGREFELGVYQPRVIRAYIEANFELRTNLTNNTTLYTRIKPSSVY